MLLIPRIAVIGPSVNADYRLLSRYPSVEDLLSPFPRAEALLSWCTLKASMSTMLFSRDTV